MELFTSEQMRRMDAYAISNLGIASTLLMDNAAKAVVSAVEEYASNRRIAIFCGSGNNGGDGLIVARLLWRWSAGSGRPEAGWRILMSGMRV